MEKFTVKEVAITDYIHILDDAVEQNAELVAMTIEKQVERESVATILNAYIDRLLALLLRDYDKDRLLEVISSGVLFTLRSVLEDKLYDNQLIKDSIENKNEIAV
ncbi:hypothetical protein [Bacillus sp. J37]|uniref:hypothetical protein n=1 Tax=Bacillus sp. J37 TaxID=935837 RepID=UPI00047DDBDC|nr:hypothetical protein [Bacillus sp. J37]